MTDMIVKWSEVRSGDLVLLDDCLITAERVDICQKPWGDETTFTAVDVFSRLDNGMLTSSERHGDRYTAVRRPAPDSLTDVPMVCTSCRKPVTPIPQRLCTTWQHADWDDAKACAQWRTGPVKAMVAAGNENVPGSTP